MMTANTASFSFYIQSGRDEGEEKANKKDEQKDREMEINEVVLLTTFVMYFF